MFLIHWFITFFAGYVVVDSGLVKLQNSLVPYFFLVHQEVQTLMTWCFFVENHILVVVLYFNIRRDGYAGFPHH